MRTLATKARAINQYNGLGNQLWDLAGNRPSLDLRFADDKSLVDATTGTNLVDHTRASSGTYVDGDGLIKTATTNLLSWSEDFTNAAWQTTGPGEVTVIPGVADPFGGTNATTLFHDSGAGDTGWLRRISSGTIGLSYRLSFWIRRRSGSGAFIVILGDNIGQTVSGITSEWQRVSVSNIPTSTTNRVYFKVDSAGDQFDIFGAQLEQSSTVGEYIKTTSTINSAPRFDHDPTTGESLGLLVEEQRTNLLLHSACDSNWPTGGFGVATYDLGLSALGVFSGVQIASGGQNWHSIYRAGLSLTASTVYAFTLFYRAGTSGRVRLVFRDNSTSTETIINGLTGSLSVSASSAGAATVLSQFLCLDGLTYVVTGTFTPNGTSADYWYRIGPDSTTSGQTVIALGGQLEAGSFPTSYIPTTTSAVTRAADVARISGNNFGTFNLLAYSEEFDDASWTKTNTTVFSDQTIAPDGTLTADAVVGNSGNAVKYVYQTYVTAPAGVYTFSVYLKRKDRDTVVVRTNDQTGANGVLQTVSLLNGSLVGSPVLQGTATDANSSIESVGNDWYRVSITCTYNSAVSQIQSACLLVYAATTDTNGFYIWGAQLEQSDVATSYVKSNVTFTSRASSATYYDKDGVIQTAAVDEARTAAYLPDGNGNFISAGPLLLEGAGTNLVQKSEDLTSWLTTTATKIYDAAAVAPDGTLGVWIGANASGTGLSSRVQPPVVSYTAGTVYTVSVFCKAKEVDTVAVFFNSPDFGYKYSSNYVDLNTGAVGGSNPQFIKVEPFPNGWYRISASQAATASATSYLLAVAPGSTGDVNSLAGNGVDGIYIWGAQVEASPYATSYIPTAGSAVTRAADVSDGGANTFGNSWYRQDEGTVFVETQLYSTSARNAAGFDINDNSANNRAIFRAFTTGSADQFTVRSGGSTVAQISSIGSPSVAIRKSAATISLNSYAISADGASPVEDTSGALPISVSQLFVGSALFGAESMGGYIRRLTYWQTRLPNETLSTITQ